MDKRSRPVLTAPPFSERVRLAPRRRSATWKHSTFTIASVHSQKGVFFVRNRIHRPRRIGIPDLPAAKEYYDELTSILGLREWFETGPGGPLNYGPDGARGSQLFFYQAEEPGTYSRGQIGLHHLAFLVESRAVVREAHEWARARGAVILDEPQEFPQYGEHCYATYWLDPHGFKLEAVCHTPEES